ncbi:pyrimidine reductase family protein [Agromyces sp. SYSU T00194]|uniref:pyrimidine reductase family protein n=1 Tax=Agromyces chitinivorans TaxID=3158560 RepID=UPI0033957CF0
MIDRDAMRTAYAYPDGGALRANMISSLDGAAVLDGRSGGLGGEDDQQLMGVLRAVADVVLVAGGTLRHEGYGALRLGPEHAAWRRSVGEPAHPRLAIVSSSLAFEASDPIFADAPARPVVLTHAGSPADRRAALAEVADVLVLGEDAVDLPAAVAALRRIGHGRVLCEGGPTLLGALVDAGLVDELCLTLGPVVAGGDAGRIVVHAAERARRMHLVHALPSGDLVFLRYRSA